MPRPDLAARLAVYLVADPDQTAGSLIGVVTAALRGGVTAVQLRAKEQSDREALRLALEVRALCHRHAAIFLVNDRVDVSLAAHADGVHLGVDDLPLEQARRLTDAAGRPDFLLGYSPDGHAKIAPGRGDAADYLGVGPVYATASKSDAGSAIGLDGLARRIRAAALPVIGIGGIDAGNAGDVIAAGAVGVAVVGNIMRAADPERAARELVQAVGSVRAATGG